MLLNASDIQHGGLVEADVCIVGAGPAGITLGRELAAESHSVCLLESGGLDFDADAQALCMGDASGTLLAPHSGYEHLSRLRMLGGATGHWGGVLRPLDAIDFTDRSWVPHGGWPLTAVDLAPYYKTACSICGIPAFDDESTATRQFERPMLAFHSRNVLTQILHQNLFHFGETYRAHLVRDPRIRVILHATATEVETHANSRAVERVRVSSLGGRRFDVRARVYVLAAGGLENARLLLLSNRTQPAGLGNDHDQVGRYFMDHPHVPIGRIVIWRPVRELSLYMDFEHDRVTGARTTAAFRLSDSIQHTHRLLNANFTLVRLQTPFSASRSGYEAFLLSELAEAHPGMRQQRDFIAAFDRWYESYAKHTSLFESIDHVAGDLDGDDGADKDDSSVFRGLLFARAEQAPNPDSRVLLGERRDALGQPQISLRWNLTERDRESLVASVKLLARELGQARLGRAQALMDSSVTWPVAGGGFHHMGSTRMHTDAKHGVVDRDCRVHGVSNLYIAGSSVFPTSGHANPTLTLIALSVRLAQHLSTSL